MMIYKDKCQFGWEGDNGVGEKLIQQIIEGKKTATCASKVSYKPDELAETYALVGKMCTVVNKFNRDHIKAWNGMATEGSPLTGETILVVELFELVKENA